MLGFTRRGRLCRSSPCTPLSAHWQALPACEQEASQHHQDNCTVRTAGAAHGMNPSPHSSASYPLAVNNLHNLGDRPCGLLTLRHLQLSFSHFYWPRVTTVQCVHYGFTAPKKGATSSIQAHTIPLSELFTYSQLWKALPFRTLSCPPGSRSGSGPLGQQWPCPVLGESLPVRPSYHPLLCSPPCAHLPVLPHPTPCALPARTSLGISTPKPTPQEVLPRPLPAPSSWQLSPRQTPSSPPPPPPPRGLGHDLGWVTPLTPNQAAPPPPPAPWRGWTDPRLWVGL